MSAGPWQRTALLTALALVGLAAACGSEAATGTGAIAGAVGGGKGPEACPPSTGKARKVHAALAGESRSCKALGVAACKLGFSGSYGEDVYSCFNAAGELIVTAPVSESASLLPCSQGQLDAWVAAYDTPCWRWVARAALPASAITLLLATDALPKHVCSNIDGTIFRFTAACAEHTYAIDKTTGGGNFHGSWWSLNIAPPTMATLRGGYPFLGCGNFAAVNDTGCQWQFGVTQDAEHLAIATDDVSHPCGGGSAVWAEVLGILTGAFTSCGAVYAF